MPLKQSSMPLRALRLGERLSFVYGHERGTCPLPHPGYPSLPLCGGLYGAGSVDAQPAPVTFPGA